ncbi:MAG: hypothetical protein ACO1G2_04890 [Bacteroidota bacterium]|nr:hypothetical protein [Bacteroidia bacterium]HRB52146.1 hypothetical protein [Bacteroidia bacterium]
MVYDRINKEFSKRRKFFLLLLMLSVFSPALRAQENITVQQTLDYINQKFAGKYVVSINYGVLIATYFDGETKYREDQAAIKDLDATKVYYNSKAGMLLINCTNPQKKCVTREFLGKRLFYSRISFPVSYGQKTNDGLVKAFQHLIHLINDKNYENSEPFE